MLAYCRIHGVFGAGQIPNDSNFENGTTSVEVEALKYFMETKNHPNLEGGIVIFAAGNESAPMAGYPGASDDYVSVAATAADFTPAVYTNYGPGTSVSAPGGQSFCLFP